MRYQLRHEAPMLQVNDKLLQEMTDTIVRAAHPRAVILFGSHARGTAGPQSDLDFLIVEDDPFGPGRSRRKEIARILRQLAGFPLPIDVVLVTADEAETWRTWPNHVVAHAFSEGKLLYEHH